MVAVATLRYLATQKLKDAEVLYRNERNAGAIYLMGFALELGLKWKISKTLGFNNGFPESRAEFTSYLVQISAFNTISTGIALQEIKEIKNHDLNKLISFSGVEAAIVNAYYKDGVRVKNWNPENRYKRIRYTRAFTSEFITSAKQILNQIV